jgi:hypothetical protein
VQDNHGNHIKQNVMINGNTIISAGEIIGTPGDYMGSGTSENRMPIISIDGKTVYLAQEQYGRWQTDGEGNTGDKWVPFKTSDHEYDKGNTSYIIKSLECILVGEILTATITDTWKLSADVPDPVGVKLQFRRVPTN